MIADGHACIPVVDTDGQVVAHALASPGMDETALLGLVQAAKRLQAEQDAADPEAAAERARRWEAGQQRIAARMRRLRGEAG
jgi:hypothetical protein